MESKLGPCCFLLLQALALASSPPQPLLHQYQTNCTLHCPLQNGTQDILYEVGCGADCKISQCLKGCSLWEKALEASCQTVCNGTQEVLPPKELYCVMGCNDALNRYLQTLKEEIGTPAAPALVADSLTATSLRLEWNRNPYLELTAAVQWRSLNFEPATWQYAANQSWDVFPGQVQIGGLRPYTNYEFRVVLLAQESELSYSEPSLVIGTLATGLPSSPPSMVRAAATDTARVSVSWSPGPSPNGPILSYVVAIDELPSGYKAHKDIPVSEKKEFYMFGGLLPLRNYSVSVAMRNAVGVGPSATAVVSTPPLPSTKRGEKTILILGAHHNVISQAADMLDEPVVMYHTQHKIRGVAVHIRRNLLFVSDSLGRVLVKSSRGADHPKVLLPSTESGEDDGLLKPHSLSVDWLNDQLYILGQVGKRWQVSRCELDGTGMTVAIAGLLDKPLHVEVDPYNGYLFWVMEGAPRGGLYRLDIADISNGIKHEVMPDLILADHNLGAFTVDHTNFRILVSSHSKNTVLAVSLDGKEVSDLRHNTQQPQFSRVLSLTMANGLFYWTNGERVLTEEYHHGQDSYFHNLIVPDVTEAGYVSIGVDLLSAQPVPAPVNPPTGLEAVMSGTHMKASWVIPHLLGGQGKGAWQNWWYQLSIDDGLNSTLVRRINATRAVVQGLKPGVEYRVKCAAATVSGVGPWSSTFIGRTLQFGASARIYWGTVSGELLASDPAGDDLSTHLRLGQVGGKVRIADIAWLEDVLFLVTNSTPTGVIWYNTTSKQKGRLTQLGAVGSLAVDWIARKLYWSNPKQQLITRGNLDGTDQEPLPILTVAKELNVDSSEAFIYWSTGHAVECARLNGKQRRIYYPAELFSGKQVMGLTLDAMSRSVFWVVRNYEGSTLFKAKMSDGTSHQRELELTKVALSQNSDVLGPLIFLDGRLFWLRDDRRAVISDPSGAHTALLSLPSLENLSVMTVVTPPLHSSPNDTQPSAVPTPVNASSVKIVGNHSVFSITWSPVTNVNIGRVFYELKVSSNSIKEVIVEVKDPIWSYPVEEKVPPYTLLEVTLRAFTYWGGSSAISTHIRTPQAVPSSPARPRLYVTVLPHEETEVLFRWDSPSSPNGLIIAYDVVCWVDGSETFLCHSRDVPSMLSFTTRQVPFNVSVFFQVRACTISGCGPPSKVMSARTDRDKPVPRLVTSTNSSVVLLDVDRGTNTSLGAIFTAATSLTVTQSEIYWMDESQILTSRPGAHKHRILTLNGTGSGLAVDWIANTLYWAETYQETEFTVRIRRLELSQYEYQQKIVVTDVVPRSSSVIVTLQANPLQNTIYWTEKHLGTGITSLVRSRMDGTDLFYLFSGRKSSRSTRSIPSACRSHSLCPFHPKPGPIFAVDHLSSVILWVDVTSNRLIGSDLNGCGCTVIVDGALRNDSGLPPTSIAADSDWIYWSNATENRLYTISKKELSNYEPVEIHWTDLPGVGSITAFGSHLLPLPQPECLTPSAKPKPPELISKTSSSLVLRLEPSDLPEMCSSTSRPTPMFTLYYQSVVDSNCSDYDLSDCLIRTGLLDLEILVDGLLPYTQYKFFVSETNAFAANVSEELSAVRTYQTSAGAPSPVQDVECQVLSPTTLAVTWAPPRLFNSDAVSYEVHWTSENLVDGARQRGEQTVPGNAQSSKLHRLSPSTLYLISVRAFSRDGEAFSESAKIESKTFPEPNNLTLVNLTAYSMELSWTRDPSLPYLNHELEYVDGSTADWGLLNPLESTDPSVYTYSLSYLKPKTVYTFRLKIIYKDPEVPFFWPTDSRFTFKTLGDRPSRPGPPVVHHVSADIAQVTWEPSRENGSPISSYQLESATLNDERNEVEEDDERRSGREANSTELKDNVWSQQYEGKANTWKLTNLDMSLRYRFRVRALNEYGWSEYSESPGYFDLVRPAFLHQEVTLVLWVLVPAAVVLSLLVFSCVLYRHERTKKWPPPSASPLDKGPDVELASLRQIPRWSALVQSTNVLYTASGQLAPVEHLPHLRRDQITLTKFLGSGAFGEVFEGLARSLPDSERDVTRVAVKTLRKGASETEKSEFLKEAQLMSNFRHAHILQLLGVCLDNDPHFIIMELMEGGDLLSYLRASRPTVISPNRETLNLIDLTAMCVDVARGCCYLEEMHFVHRDLACRNCLVSSRRRVDRVVKIGDFGLARDIYKNDYYRKEGEGLLPVRWMAPESLVDGVFTSQSDVWSFGVLLWEILSLGQQPYPARNNLEVLNYVRIGGRLGQPLNSNHNMYELMMKCWSFNPDERPTFKYCLEVLEEILAVTEDVPLNTVTCPTGTLRHAPPSSPPPSSPIPKYLELLYDGGYEIPRPLPAPEAVPDGPAPSSPDATSLDRLLPTPFTNPLEAT